jgi:hypothetical protein
MLQLQTARHNRSGNISSVKRSDLKFNFTGPLQYSTEQLEGIISTNPFCLIVGGNVSCKKIDSIHSL